MKELLKETAASLIKLNSQNNIIEEGNQYFIIGKYGVDGSGSPKIRHQLVDNEIALLETGHLDPSKTSNFLLSCYCPLEVQHSNISIWQNPVPNSTAFARPVSLTRAPEDRNTLTHELGSSFHLIREPYEEDLLLDNKLIKLIFTTECSMIDGKMVSLLQGDSGAFCHYCHVSRADANNLTQIETGFNITKDYNSCKEAW